MTLIIILGPFLVQTTEKKLKKINSQGLVSVFLLLIRWRETLFPAFPPLAIFIADQICIQGRILWPPASLHVLNLAKELKIEVGP